jgi:hypothetical protein
MVNTPSGPVISEGVDIDIERPDSPVKIVANHLQLNLEIGDQIPVSIYGTYSSGAIVDLHRSTRTKYEPASSRIVSVTKDGVVTAVAAGATTIVIRHENLQVIVPVVVAGKPK